MTPAEARSLTDQIIGHAEQLWLMVVQAWEGEAWKALGYGDWGAYCKAEFDSAHLSVPRPERKQVVALLRDAGMSQRKIASAVNVDHRTVGHDLEHGENSPPKPKRTRKLKVADPPNRTDVLLSVAVTRYTTCGMTGEQVTADIAAMVEKLLGPLADHDCEVEVTVASSKRVAAVPA